MEAALFFLDCLLLVLLCFYCQKAERSGRPEDLGFFSYREEEPPASKQAGTPPGAGPR